MSDTPRAVLCDYAFCRETAVGVLFKRTRKNRRYAAERWVRPEWGAPALYLCAVHGAQEAKTAKKYNRRWRELVR